MLLEHVLHVVDLLEVLAHVGVQDHLDDEVAELQEVRALHVGEDVAVVLADRSVDEKEFHDERRTFAQFREFRYYSWDRSVKKKLF